MDARRARAVADSSYKWSLWLTLSLDENAIATEIYRIASVVFQLTILRWDLLICASLIQPSSNDLFMETEIKYLLTPAWRDPTALCCQRSKVTDHIAWAIDITTHIHNVMQLNRHLTVAVLWPIHLHWRVYVTAPSDIVSRSQTLTAYVDLLHKTLQSYNSC